MAVILSLISNVLLVNEFVTTILNMVAIVILEDIVVLVLITIAIDTVTAGIGLVETVAKVVVGVVNSNNINMRTHITIRSSIIAIVIHVISVHVCCKYYKHNYDYCDYDW